MQNAKSHVSRDKPRSQARLLLKAIAMSGVVAPVSADCCIAETVALSHRLASALPSPVVGNGASFVPFSSVRNSAVFLKALDDLEVLLFLRRFDQAADLPSVRSAAPLAVSGEAAMAGGAARSAHPVGNTGITSNVATPNV